MTRRVLFYVQHLLGVGHLRRAEVLAKAMAAAGLDVTVAYGGLPLPDVPFDDVACAQLPPATIADEDFSTLRDTAGTPVDEAWKAARRQALIDLYKSTAPDMVLIELFPFGRRMFRFELIPLLDMIHAQQTRPRVLCSVRDILVQRRPERAAETIETLRQYFDAALVHSDPALIPFQTTFPAAEHIADLIHYTGYISGKAPKTGAGDPHGEVIVSAGGGAVGAPLLSAAVEARATSTLSDRTWRFLTGPNLTQGEYETLAARADERTIVERFRPDFAALLSGAALSISQAGYNTTMDILASGVRAVVVPYEAPGETEQRLRAEILAEKGVLTLVPAAELTPANLSQAIGEATTRSPAAVDIDLSGAVTTARMVRDIALHKTEAGV